MEQENRNRLGFAIGFVLIVMFAFIASANASPHTDVEVTGKNTNIGKNMNANAVDTRARAGAVSGSVSGSTSGSMAESSASNGDQISKNINSNDAAASNGDQVSMNSSQFYALSLMFPNSIDCFTGAQGGAHDGDANGGSSGFLGFHILNKSCWMDRLASKETDIELNAKLRCHDKHYRNAIAHDVSYSKRRERCIELKVNSGMAQMAELQRQLFSVERENQQLATANEVCEEGIERCEAKFAK